MSGRHARSRVEARPRCAHTGSDEADDVGVPRAFPLAETRARVLSAWAAEGRAGTARIHDYYLGGRDAHPVDMDTAEQVLAIAPELRDAARTNQAFLARAVRYLAHAGIRQYLDIGAGYPGPHSTAIQARDVIPDARVAYVDCDRFVVAHLQALAVSEQPTLTCALRGDLRAADDLLAHKQLHGFFHPGEPVALILGTVLHHLPDHERPQQAVARLAAALPRGSCLVITHLISDCDSRDRLDAAAGVYRQRAAAPLIPRTRAQINAFFQGTDLVEPGLVPVVHWRPDEPHALDGDGWLYGGVACRR